MPNGSQTPSSFQDCITVSDFGRYTCEGFNEVGKETVEVIFGPETSRCTKIFVCIFFSVISILGSTNTVEMMIAEYFLLLTVGGDHFRD